MDEVCCWFETQYNFYIAEALLNISNIFKTIGDPQQCCQNIVTAISNIVAVLNNQLNNDNAAYASIITRLDFAPIITALNTLNNTVSNAGAPVNLTLGAINNTLTQIATAVATAPAVDLKPIVDEMEKRGDDWEVPQPIIDELIKEGATSKELGQLISGSKYSHVKPAVAVTPMKHYLDVIAKTLGPTLYGGGLDPKPIAAAVKSGVETIFTDIFNVSSAVFTPVVDGILNAHRTEIAKLHNVGPCQEQTGATALLTEAIGAALAAHLASMAAEAIYPTKALGLEKVADLLATIAGVEDIIGGIIGVEITQLIKIPHTYCINAQGRTILPATGPAANMHARGIIGDTDARSLLAFNGMSGQYEDATLTAAFRGLNPRMMLRLIETGLFTDADIADELTFEGMRPASQHRLLMAAPYLATEPERKQLRSTLEKGFVDGFLSDQELTQELDNAEHNTSRTFLILDRVRLEKRMRIATELEAEYGKQYLGGLIDLATYESDLLGLGLQTDSAHGLMAKNEAAAAVTLAHAEARAAAALARATTAAERKAAIKNYLAGNIDAAGLTAALLLTGLTATQAAAFVDMAVIQRQGTPRSIFGLRQTPDQANLTRERVTALTDQRKKQLIDDATYVAQLKALGIPDTNINALRATADALISPKASATLIPVITK